MKDEVIRKYSMIDVDLAMFASNLTLSMTRDIAEFTLRGVTALEISALGTKATAFFAFPPDEYYVAQIMAAAQAKNALRAAMEIKIRDVVQIAITKWGRNSPEVRLYVASDLTHESDKAFESTAQLCVINATAQLTSLSPLGLTQAMIDAIDADATAFLTQLNNLHAAEQLRSAKAVERIEDGNELYALVIKYCDMGKFIWDDVDANKYKDYVVTEYAPGVPGKIMMLQFAAPSQTLSWAAEPSATEYQLEFSVITPQLNWVEVYRGPMTSFIHLMGPGQTVYRVRGINSNGYGYWSDNLIVTRI